MSSVNANVRDWKNEKSKKKINSRGNKRKKERGRGGKRERNDPAGNRK